MKIRTDFVTNSSSSSFIVSCKKDLVIDIKDKEIQGVRMLEYADPENIHWEKLKERAAIIEDTEQLFEMIKEEFYSWDEKSDLEILMDEEYKDIFEQYKESLDENKTLFYFNRISDCSDSYDQLSDLERCISHVDRYSDKIEVKSYDH